jgi:lactate dehydrogenase-like 2-hydroxyacid dehydrogenase
MKIAIIEPLDVERNFLENLACGLKENGHELVFYDTRVTEEEALIERGKEADIIVVANVPVSGKVISGWENVKMISVAFTGVDHIDLEMCEKKKIAVSNAAGYSTDAVAELAIGLMISVYRSIPTCEIRTRNSCDKDGLIGSELRGKKVGLIGTGHIGTRVAEIAKVFKCELLAYNRSSKAELEALGVNYLPLEEVMRKSDIISLHVPFNSETKGLISRDMLALMKPSAILINTARGPIIDNEALAEALNSGSIAGAGIDVFDMEPPLPADYCLLKTKNTVLTPHVAFATKESMNTRAEITIHNIEQWLNGKQINIIL